MKNLITTLSFLILTLSVFSFAQEGVRLGAKVGLGGTTVSVSGADDELPDPEMTSSYLIGAALLMPLTDEFNIEANLLYAKKGYSMSEGSMEATVSMYYITLPLLAQYTIGNLFLMAGPELAFFLSGEAEIEVPGETVTIDLKRKEVSAMDIGLTLGAGLKITEQLIVDGRFTYGVTNTDAKPEGNEAINHMTFCITGGYFF